MLTHTFSFLFSFFRIFALCFFLPPVGKGLLVIMSYACCRLHTPQIMNRKTIYFKHVSSSPGHCRDCLPRKKLWWHQNYVTLTINNILCHEARVYQYKNKSSIVIITIKILASCPSKNKIWVENISLKTWQKYSDETFDSFILGFSPQGDFQQNMWEGYCVDVKSKYFNDSISDPINASVSL